ncbi:DNA mismatch repair protein MutL [Salinigranum rubrum]|uniref:DNA mismatch repair protein MutL n=1 Tax=Salinigranum rubrum TaxID=755307 RepID=A0A2I8VMZ9_9EURY|nr:DNA mismatch repair endonuclease MutL [Salinigranum rubrum]AUV83312.1 DNA mismatch repair protein MutL [Salinigranum rubrum]
MTRIRRLDPETRKEIAAGEVITRPVDAVRELVENSLDADASHIEVAVDGDGTDLVRVRDDGHGMRREDAPLAVERHTTSKLTGPGDIERVSTLGFRGEALPSIAHVADLTVTTNDGGPRGTRVRVRDGAVETETAGRARGTTVEVRDLFHNRPARRKHLGSAKAEFARVSKLLSRYALCHSDTRFSLSHDGRETFSTPGSGDTDALLGVYDRTVAGQSTTFSFAADGSDGGEGNETRVDGVLCYPSVTRATRDHVHVAVNGRPLVDESLRRAVVAGYGSLLPRGRAPVAVVRVTLPPESVDHNVHPAKAEVAFRDDSVYARVEQGVRDALSTADLRRSGDVAMDLETSLTPLDGSSRLGDVTVIGQFRDLYLLCAADDDLLVVDQHAAHERINYERLRAAVGDVPSAEVDPPATLSVSAAEASLVDSLTDELGRLGYEASTFGGGTVRVSRVPAPLGRTATPESLRAVLAALDGGEGETPERVRDELLKELACHPSLKAGETLSVETGEKLIERLGACDQPYACPHGRPTVLAIDEETLVRGFERENTRFG